MSRSTQASVSRRLLLLTLVAVYVLVTLALLTAGPAPSERSSEQQRRPTGRGPITLTLASPAHQPVSSYPLSVRPALQRQPEEKPGSDRPPSANVSTIAGGGRPSSGADGVDEADAAAGRLPCVAGRQNASCADAAGDRNRSSYRIADGGSGSDSDEADRGTNTSERSDRSFLTISIWRVGERMKRRFMRSFGTEEKDPFANCSVNDCRLETNDSLVEDSDAVMFHLHLLKDLTSDLPKRRSPDQKWIFFTDESPYHTFMADPQAKMKDLNGIFNLSMTYRSDSDIVVPYGRTEKLPVPQSNESYVSAVMAKSKGVTILGSNCGSQNHRWEYVRELQKFIEVDVFGKCGKAACPGHFTRDCDVISGYKFYLAFENSNCVEYITEKLWYNAFLKMAIPIVMGAPKQDYKRLCPPNSFIHVEDFASPEQLADHIRQLQANTSALLKYHQWRKDYRILNEHGYFGSPSLHLCRMCEHLHKRPFRRKVIYKLENWWSVKRDCRPPVF